jgi:hypothetical protein
MSDQPPVILPPRQSAGTIALLLWGAILIVSGIGIGVGGMLLLRPPPQAAARNETAPPPFRPGPFVEEMRHDLNLSDQQAHAVGDAYKVTLDAVKNLRDNMLVQLTAEHEKLRQSLRQILNEQQFAQWEQRFESKRRELMPNAPPLPREERAPGPSDRQNGPPEREPGLPDRAPPPPDQQNGPPDRRPPPPDGNGPPDDRPPPQ